jgi:hypothetical protein
MSKTERASPSVLPRLVSEGILTQRQVELVAQYVVSLPAGATICDEVYWTTTTSTEQLIAVARAWAWMTSRGTMQ